MKAAGWPDQLAIRWAKAVKILSISLFLPWPRQAFRSEEHTSELQSLMRISYAVFCLKKKIYYQSNLLRSSYTNYINTLVLTPTQSQVHVSHYVQSCQHP